MDLRYIMVFADSDDQVVDQDVMQFLVAVPGSGVHKCTLCGKISKSKWSMQRHMILIHTQPTNDVCKYCQKVFKHKYYLDLHIRSKECLANKYFKDPFSSNK